MNNRVSILQRYSRFLLLPLLLLGVLLTLTASPAHASQKCADGSRRLNCNGTLSGPALDAAMSTVNEAKDRTRKQLDAMGDAEMKAKYGNRFRAHRELYDKNKAAIESERAAKAPTRTVDVSGNSADNFSGSGFAPNRSASKEQAIKKLQAAKAESQKLQTARQTALAAATGDAERTRINDQFTRDSKALTAKNAALVQSVKASQSGTLTSSGNRTETYIGDFGLDEDFGDDSLYTSSGTLTSSSGSSSSFKFGSDFAFADGDEDFGEGLDPGEFTDESIFGSGTLTSSSASSNILSGLDTSALLSAGGGAIAAFGGGALAKAFLGGSDGPTYSNIAENIVTSVERTPGLITALSYLLGLIFGAIAIVKTKEHVEKPQDVSIRWPVTHALTAGAMFSLPIVYESLATTIGFGSNDFSNNAGISTFLSNLSGMFSSFIPTQDFNQVLNNIIESVEDVPGAISGLAYLLGLVLGVTGVLKLKEHVEQPQQITLKEGVIRLFIAGALFSLPTIYTAMTTSIEGDGNGILGTITDVIIASASSGLSTESKTGGCLAAPLAGAGASIAQAAGLGGSSTLGSVVCNIFRSTSAFPGFLTALAHLFALFIGLWGVLKVKEHVLDPRQTPIFDPFSKFIVAGGLFALPSVVTVAYNSVASILFPHTNTGFNGDTEDGPGLLSGAGNVDNLFNGFLGVGGGKSNGGLDAMVANMMNDMFAPMTVLINWFGVVAGFILIFIGITRLMKSAQEGAKGPGGIGTIMTFITGGALLAFSPMVGAFTSTLFGDPLSNTYGILQYGVAGGLEIHEIKRIHIVISAVVKFVLILGLISLLRGIFIVRGVAEGSQQASIMAGLTHLIGGSLAVNLGSVINAVESTLGVTQYGILFQ